MNKRGLLVVLSGPSGSGKDSIVENMLTKSPEIKQSISATTRAPRTGEQHGVDYYYLSPEEFKSRIERDEMLEHTLYVGNYYGTPKKEIEDRLAAGDVVLLVIEVQGGMQVKKSMRDDSLLLFIHAPSYEELRSRLTSRGTESDESIEARLARSLEEMQYAKEYDYVAINDTIERCSDELLSIIHKTVESRNG